MPTTNAETQADTVARICCSPDTKAVCVAQLEVFSQVTTETETV